VCRRTQLYRCCKSKNDGTSGVTLDPIVEIAREDLMVKPAAGLALAEGDHAKFSRVSMSNGTKRRSGYHEVLPRDSTVKRWTPLPSAFLAPPAFPADFGDFVYPYLLYFIPLMILGIYSPIYQSSEDSTCSNSFFIVFLAKPMTLSLRL